MTNAVIAWIEKEVGIVKTDIVAIAPSVFALFQSFMAKITPVMEKAASDAVLAAVTVPGTGAVKFAAALASAGEDLATQGVPIAEEDLKALIQVAYNALPASVTSTAGAQAVEAVANSEVDALAAEVNPAPAA